MARAVAMAVALVQLPALADYRQGLEYLGRGRFDEAYAELKDAADAGDVNAMRYLGWLLERGMRYHGTEFAPRPVESVKWYRKAAEAGDKHSADMLAVAYTCGHGVPQQTDEALAWFGKNHSFDPDAPWLAKYPEADRRDILAWTLAMQTLLRREVDRARRIVAEGTVDVWIDAAKASVVLEKSDALAKEEGTALAAARAALQAALPPPPGAVRSAFKYRVTIHFGLKD
jgi:tetratricopeptide (TPR) repeat protein